MRHAEVSYVGQPDPEVVPLTERGHEQAAAAHRALAGVELDLVVTSTLPRTAETAAVVAPGSSRSSVAEFAEWRGGRLDAVPPRRARADVRRLADDQRRSTSASSAASRSARRSTASCPRSSDSSRDAGRPRSPSSTAASTASSLARARRRPRVLRDVRAGAGVHQRARPRRRRTLDRAHRQLHPVRPAPPRARDDDGAPLARAAGVAQPRLIATTPPSATPTPSAARRVSRSCSSTCASSTVTTG